MAIASLRVPIAALPAVDNSWLSKLGGEISDGIDKVEARKNVSALYGGPKPQSLLSRLLGGQNTSPAASAAPTAGTAATVAAIPPAQGAVSAEPNDIYSGFIGTVKDAGLTNPYGLAAVAATGRAESGWDPSKVNAAWADPSRSGQAGTAGGIMSWRNERLANLRNFAQSQGEDPSNISPQMQAKFFVQEDPSLIQRLNAAKSPQEAATLMANAWKFGGYDQQGGEAARRQALTQNYYATQFANQQPSVATAAPASVGPAPNGGLAPVSRAAPVIPVTASALPPPPGIRGGPPVTEPDMEQGDGPGPTQVASLGPQAGSPAAPAPVNPATASPTAMLTELGLNNPDPSQQQYRDPQVTTAFRGQPARDSAIPTPSTPNTRLVPPPQAAVPQHMAQNVSPAVAAPAEASPVTGDMLGRLITNPYTRELGLSIGKEVWAGKQQGFSFLMAKNGDLIRTDKQGGATVVGNYAKDPTGLGGEEAGLNLVYGQDGDGNTVAFQPLKGGGLKQVALPNGVKLTPGVSNIDTGTGTRTINTKTGATITDTPKDLTGKTEAETTGKNIAEAKAALPQIESAANQMLSTIDSLDKDPYLPSMLGPVNSRLPTLTSDGERVKSKMDQIGGQSFLQAYNTLRGGGQITEVEGEKATKAMGRLNTAQNETDYREALQELRDIVSTGIQRARQKASGSTNTSPATSDAPDPLGIR
ncbi:MULTISPECIES: phage tail tip lysozyme [unclassified Rhizobium]|uniref:phage tail tip lysozyme n=1 Tax=unclassified Rhizobium TaxID=2613769 RepID=UPI00115DE297|nr:MULTISPECIES: phage tail tip lysozyme [unclassified Rhizobium]TQX88446.1 hypothetical protein EQW76_11455 [Rhizobium sp. rho-13.1]TQY12641.1 hypothetical protein EQW74_15100 [Rhizobium sp. rho-1.1]